MRCLSVLYKYNAACVVYYHSCSVVVEVLFVHDVLVVMLDRLGSPVHSRPLYVGSTTTVVCCRPTMNVAHGTHFTVVPQIVVVGSASRSFAAIAHLLQTVGLRKHTPRYVQCIRAFDVWST